MRNSPSACALLDDLADQLVGLADLREVRLAERVRRARDLDDDDLHQLGVVAVGVDDERRDRLELLARPAMSWRVDLADHVEHHVPALEEERVEAPRPSSGSSGTRARRRRRPRRRCRDTRQRVEALTGETRTAASRIRRRFSAARPGCARWPSGGLAAARVDLRPAVGQRRQVAGGSAAWRSRSRSATMTASASGGLREHDPPRVDDHRPPARAHGPAAWRRSGWRR